MIFDNVFEIDYDDLVVELLPTRLRKPKHIFWLRLLITPYKKMLNELRVFRQQSLYKITHDSRSGSIENVVNDAFDIDERRIRIRRPQKGVPTYLTQFTPFYLSTGEQQAEESNPLITYLPQFTPFYIYNEGEAAEVFVDFEVVLPKDLNLQASDEIRLKSLVKYYALKDKTFKITYNG